MSMRKAKEIKVIFFAIYIAALHLQDRFFLKGQNDRFRSIVLSVADKLNDLGLFFEDNFRIFELFPQGNCLRKG